MTGAILRITMLLLLLLMISSGQLLTSAQALAGPLSVYTHTGSKEGFYSNSHLLISDSQALLIDAQFNVNDARSLTNAIYLRKLTIDTILLTHPHPDHYYGLEYCSDAFATADVIAGPGTAAIVQRTLNLWAAVQPQPQVMGCQRHVRALPHTTESGNTLLFANHPLEITHRANRESVENTVIHVPGIDALFTGDLVSNGFHLWLAEGRIDRWLDVLEELEQLQNVTTVYPGHGPPGPATLITETSNYIQHFQAVISNADSPGDALQRMHAMYPDHQLPEVLLASVHRMMDQ